MAEEHNWQALLAAADVVGGGLPGDVCYSPDTQGIVTDLVTKAERKAEIRKSICRVTGTLRRESRPPGGEPDDRRRLAGDHFEVVVSGDVSAALKTQIEHLPFDNLDCHPIEGVDQLDHG